MAKKNSFKHKFTNLTNEEKDYIFNKWYILNLLKIGRSSMRHVQLLVVNENWIIATEKNLKENFVLLQ